MTLHAVARYFWPRVWVVLALALALVLTGCALWLVERVHAARRLEQEVCRAQVELRKARSPLLRGGLVEHPDPCQTLAGLR